MKAICIHHFEGLDTLSYQDLPRPMPTADELLIRVHAAGVNPVDSLRTSSDLENARAYGVRARRILVRPQAEHLARIGRLAETDQLRPTIAAVHPLQEVKQAHEQIERGPTRGKVVLHVARDSV